KIVVYCSCFFFSSRRRHTISKRDWSSDVCSSDLRSHGRHMYCPETQEIDQDTMWDMASCTKVVACTTAAMLLFDEGVLKLDQRGSEERRVGKEGRAGGAEWAWKGKGVRRSVGDRM